MSCNHCHKSNTALRWNLGAALACLGLVGLFLSASVEGGGFYMHGLALFGLCAAGIFNLIRKTFDENDLNTRHHA